MKTPTKKDIATFIATATYVGYLPKAPGTWGTFWGVAIAWLLWPVSLPAYLAVTAVLILVAIWSAIQYEKLTAQHDPQEIVIDEVVGYLVTMIALPPTWVALGAGFIVFRFFDILKPFPIGWVDRKIPGGFGTVLDDLLAGVVGCLVLHTLQHFFHWF
jgi:phosphatidylglycerophosphatase A